MGIEGKIEDKAMTRTFYDLTVEAFNEDVVLIEAQQRMISSDPQQAHLFIFRSDRGGAAASRIIARNARKPKGERGAGGPVRSAEGRRHRRLTRRLAGNRRLIRKRQPDRSGLTFTVKAPA